MSLCSTYTIPVQATAFSAAMVLIFPMFGIIPNKLGLDRDTGVTIVIYVCTLLTGLRFPLTTMLTFKAKARTDMENREARQERVRERARMARQDRERMQRELEEIRKPFRKRENVANSTMQPFESADTPVQ